ncbi:MAG: UDP-galactopyranose mutase [Candidatus Odinarchaeota archaeon]
MKILVVGAGITGCTLARLMKDKGNTVSIKERQDHIGGLCYTILNPNGVLYEPYGGHAFHTKDKRVQDFVVKFSKFNGYRHNKGIIINGILHHFPLSKETIQTMENSKQILKELDERPKMPDLTNFETYAISQFGITLYKLFIYNYSKKMWDIEPKELTTEYIKNRIELKTLNTHIFKDKFQGLPLNGYTEFLRRMIHGIPIELNCSEFNELSFDLILFSGRIDELLKFRFGDLKFRSLRFEYSEDNNWENENYGTINLPQHPRYIRKVNFKVMHKQKIRNTLIQYQEPIPSDDTNLPLYPIYTKKNIDLFNRYLMEACKSDKIIPIGRLGLYKYLEMGQAMSLAMNMIPLVENWKTLSPIERYSEIKKSLNN